MSGSWRTRAEAYEPLKSADLGAALRELAAVIDGLARYAPKHISAATPVVDEAIEGLRAEVAALRAQLAALKDAAPAKAAKAARVKAAEGDAST